MQKTTPDKGFSLPPIQIKPGMIVAWGLRTNPRTVEIFLVLEHHKGVLWKGLVLWTDPHHRNSSSIRSFEPRLFRVVDILSEGDVTIDIDIKG